MSAETIYKKSISFFKNCADTVVSLLKVAVLSKFTFRVPVATQESCVVLGNGPSLRQSLERHPDFFKKHALICVNSFSITTEFERLQPAYYVLLDPGFWLSQHELVQNTIQCLKTKTTWKLHLFIPPAARQSSLLLELLKENKNIQPVYFNYVVFKGFQKVAYFFYKRNLAMPQSQNVLVASIFLGINLGFKKMYVVGADHSWHQALHVNDNNVLCVKNVHFYEDTEQVTYQPFYKAVHLKEVFRMDEILVTFGKAFYGYILLNKYARSRGTVIYNASESSFIDAFERIRL